MRGRNVPVVAALILNWNGREHLVRCLQSIEGLDYPKKCLQLLVVDNGSTDGSQEAVKGFLRRRGRSYLNSSLIELPRNIGAPAALNRGLERLDRRARYVWKLDNDIIVRPGSLAALVEALEKSPLSVVGSVTRLHHGRTDREEPVGAVLLAPPRRWTRILDYVTYDELTRRNRARQLAMMFGGCCLFRRSVLEGQKPFDERFFLYFDDTEFCLRLYKKGLRFVPLENEFVYHAGSSSTESIPSVRLYYWVRNHLLLGSCYFSGLELFTFWIVQVILLPWKYVRILFALRRSGLWIGTKYFVRGYADFLRGRFGQSPTELRPTWF